MLRADLGLDRTPIDGEDTLKLFVCCQRSALTRLPDERTGTALPFKQRAEGREPLQELAENLHAAQDT
jgi:hypothetical protein